MSKKYKQEKGQGALFDHEIDRNEISDQELMQMQERINAEMITYLRTMAANLKVIFVKGNTPSLKNSKEIFQVFTKQSECCKKVGGLMTKVDGAWKCSHCGNPAVRHTKPILTKAKRVMEFETLHKDTFKTQLPIWKSITSDKKRPYSIGMYFIRDSFRMFDYVNASQVLLDMMTEAGYYPDDNVLWANPEFLGYHVDSDRACAIIVIMDSELHRIKSKING